MLETKEPGTEEAAPGEAGEAGEGGPGLKEAGAGEGGPAPPPLNPVTLSDAEARTSLHSLVSTHCCWGSGVVKQMRSGPRRSLCQAFADYTILSGVLC